jgi:hypothetical protein
LDRGGSGRGITTAAVTVANATGGRDEVLSQDEVTRQLGEETGAPVAPTPSGTARTPSADRSTPPTQTGDGFTRTLRSQAGQVVARCEGATAFLEAWSPNPGYRVDDVVRGPAAEVYLWIESDSFDDVQVFVTCQAGEPVLTDRPEPDDHGGDRDDHDDDRDDDHDD